MKRVRCQCGKLIAIPIQGVGSRFRCPSCGSVFRVRPKRASSLAPAPHDDFDPNDTEGYRLAGEESAGPQDGDKSGGSRNTRVTASQPAPVLLAASSTFQPRKSSGELAKEEDEDDAGPFLSVSALFFPWLSPTWIRWLGLSFMTGLAVTATATSAFFITIVMAFNAFGSIFTFAAMVTVCVGLWSYVTTVFVMVLEDSANGGEYLDRLPGYAWHEILPPFLRTAGAALSALSVAGGIGYLLRDVLGPWYSPGRLLLVDVIMFLVFPIFMITNSVDQSFLPLYSLPSTCMRLLRRIGYFLLFLVMSGILYVCVSVVLSVLTYIHIGFGLAASGPLLATWLLYYGHWMGRLARQLSYAD